VAKRKEKQTTVTLKSGTTIAIGGLVCYFLDGWRVGHLAEVISDHTAKVQPITRDGKARLVTVGVDDMKENF
jgi:hypothetical protein